MSEFAFLSIRRDRGTTIKSYKTASRSKSTIVSVEIEIIDGDELGYLLSQLHEAKHPPRPKPEPKPQARKALPAPAPLLSDLRGDGQ